MLKILYTKPFLKQFEKLSKAEKQKIQESVELFITDPKNSALKSHKLNGELKDFYSFSVTYNIRIVFEMQKGGVAIFLKVGTHDIYK